MGGLIYRVFPGRGDDPAGGGPSSLSYIEARPERMHEQFGKLAQEAMIAAWPCKR
jgi:hypothetical protein